MEGRATKRYATLAALTLALGGAVFLNWAFAGRTPQAGTPEAVVQTAAEADEDTVQTAAGNKRGGGTHHRPGSV